MTEDGELLRRYSENGNEEAFTQLVRRHVDVVYAAALRRMGDTHRAEDITQVVFASLAQQASKLWRRPVLIGWLFTAVHYSASAMRRNEWRRLAREREIGMERGNDAAEEMKIDWARVRPVIDELLLELAEPDRA